MNRERSYSDVHNLQVEFKTLLRQKSSDGSCEASEEFIVDFVEVQCFLHTGMILDVSVHPDDSIFQIKQIILNTATADEQFPLRGCLNPDPNSYYVTYVSQEGSNEEVIAESRTFRQLNPFLNLLKLNLRKGDRDQYMIKKQVGQLIGRI